MWAGTFLAKQSQLIKLFNKRWWTLNTKLCMKVRLVFFFMSEYIFTLILNCETQTSKGFKWEQKMFRFWDAQVIYKSKANVTNKPRFQDFVSLAKKIKSTRQLCKKLQDSQVYRENHEIWRNVVRLVVFWRSIPHPSITTSPYHLLNCLCWHAKWTAWVLDTE